MKALVKAKAEPGLWLEDLPIPDIGPNEVLIRVRKTGICGTDVHIYNWDAWSQQTIKVPMAIGHEFMGEVAAFGSEVVGFAVGERVSGEGHLTCGVCRNCRAGRRHLCRNTVGLGVNRQGCFAEYVALPAVNVFKLPPTLADDALASFLDPLGNAVHTALSFDLVGEDVLITGAGPIGLMACAVARHVGARKVVLTDVNDYRLSLGERLGATRTVNVARESIASVMPKIGMTEGFDVGLEMSGNSAALRDMLSTMVHGGRVAILGIPSAEVAIDWSNVIFKGLVLKGIYGRELFETWYKMIAMLTSGLDVSPVLTHSYEVRDYVAAFDQMRTGMSGKIILNWESLS